MLDTSARLLQLLALLQARRLWTGPDLAERLGVTVRTVRRDVDRLRSLGYPVESSSGVAGGYHLGAGAELPPLLLDDEEAVAMALALRTVGGGTVAGFEDAALSALAKLERVLPDRLRERMRAVHGGVAALHFDGARVSAEVLVSLASASREHWRVAFGYVDLRGTASERQVEPHGLVHAGVRWYLVAYDLDRADWRTFRVDRIVGEPVMGAPFLPRAVPGGSVADYVSRTVSSAPYRVQARVLLHAPRHEVAAQVPPLAGFLTECGSERCVLECGGPSAETVAVYVASLGHDFEVLEPEELHEVFAQLAGRLRRAAAPDARNHGQ